MRANRNMSIYNDLLKKDPEEENEEWNQFSLEQAMKGLENDELSEYTEADLIEEQMTK
jgi:hypothetical protein